MQYIIYIWSVKHISHYITKIMAHLYKFHKPLKVKHFYTENRMMRNNWKRSCNQFRHFTVDFNERINTSKFNQDKCFTFYGLGFSKWLRSEPLRLEIYYIKVFPLNLLVFFVTFAKNRKRKKETKYSSSFTSSASDRVH